MEPGEGQGQAGAVHLLLLCWPALPLLIPSCVPGRACLLRMASRAPYL
jgi:hypothetical protein